MSPVDELQQRLEFKKSKRYYLPRILFFLAGAVFLLYLSFTVTKWTIPVCLSFAVMMASSVYFIIVWTRYLFKGATYLIIDSSGITNRGMLITWNEIEQYATIKLGRPKVLYLKLTLIKDITNNIWIPLYDLNIDDVQIRCYINRFNTNSSIQDRGDLKE